MAKGDVKNGLSSITAASRLSIQPASGEEWFVKNIFREANQDLEWYDGTLTILWKSVTGAGVEVVNAYVTNTRYIRVKNTDAATKNIGYDGIQLK